MKTLIIRTDRLGDFYQTIPYINCLKRTYGKKNIDIVVKKHIYPHIKKKKYLYNNLYPFNEKGIFSKIRLIFELRKNKYNQIIIFDGKDRSLILSKFLKASKILCNYPVKKINFFYKIFFSKKYNTYHDNQITPVKYIYKKILDKINVKTIKKDFKILLHKSVKTINIFKYENIGDKKYTHLHVDEKWFSDFYIKDFTNINTKKNEFLLFIKKIIRKKKTNLIITTGTIDLPFVKKISTKYFSTHPRGYHFLIYGNFKIILLKKISIEYLEIITMNANNVITCHGPISLIAGSFKINLIDIIDKKREKWYYRFTSHITKYNMFYRNNFNKLSKKIILKIK